MFTFGRKIISLYDQSGVWSQPYRDAGYDVLQYDLLHCGTDVRLVPHPGKVWGILAAPPCRVFCKPGARLWREWPDSEVLEGLSTVDAVLRMVATCKPAFWALENPPGRLAKWLGRPSYWFQPWWFGDMYTKQTCLWGQFELPVQTHFTPPVLVGKPGRRDRTSRLSSTARVERSRTPAGFARAFFDANP